CKSLVQKSVAVFVATEIAPDVPVPEEAAHEIWMVRVDRVLRGSEFKPGQRIWIAEYNGNSPLVPTANVRAYPNHFAKGHEEPKTKIFLCNIVRKANKEGVLDTAYLITYAAKEPVEREKLLIKWIKDR